MVLVVFFCILVLLIEEFDVLVIKNGSFLIILCLGDGLKLGR